MTSDQLENYEEHVRSDLIAADPRTLDDFARMFSLKELLIVYAQKGFQEAADWLANEYESCVSMLAAEREAEADSGIADEIWLDNRDRARDMNLER
jgi:hypothetical protein